MRSPETHGLRCVPGKFGRAKIFVPTPGSADEPIKMVHFFIYGGVMLPISVAFLVIICMGLR